MTFRLRDLGMPEDVERALHPVFDDRHLLGHVAAKVPMTKSVDRPGLADTTSAAGVDIYVYKDSAMLDTPRDEWEPESHQFFLNAQELQELAVELLWAAERLHRRAVTASVAG